MSTIVSSMERVANNPAGTLHADGPSGTSATSTTTSFSSRGRTDAGVWLGGPRRCAAFSPQRARWCHCRTSPRMPRPSPCGCSSRFSAPRRRYPPSPSHQLQKPLRQHLQFLVPLSAGYSSMEPLAVEPASETKLIKLVCPICQSATSRRSQDGAISLRVICQWLTAHIISSMVESFQCCFQSPSSRPARKLAQISRSTGTLTMAVGSTEYSESMSAATEFFRYFIFYRY